jgi:NAD(P)-dependent dehydrogenase (short-subunit alcohol dehydrogenase family)
MAQVTQPLKDKAAIITGGSSGIGRAIALRFALAGANVSILARGEERLRHAAAFIEETAERKCALPLPCDVTEEAAVKNAFQASLQHYNALDIVVSNAGSYFSAPISATTLEDWEKMYAVHARGYFLISREAYRTWRVQGTGGNLIFVVSKNAVAVSPRVIAYSTAKAAELHLSRCLAEEWGSEGIRVNAILPDGVVTGTNIFTPVQKAEAARRHGVEINQLEDFYRQRNALNVSIKPEDIAEAALWLASDTSSKVTGATITVDGGVKTAYLR